MIRFAVWDESNQLLGQRFLPIESMNAGYRHIVLRDQWNQPLGLPTLFVYIVSSVYVPKANEGKYFLQIRVWLPIISLPFNSH